VGRDNCGTAFGTTPRNKTKSKNNEQTVVSLFPLFLLIFLLVWTTKIKRLRELCPW
jgi:hypothetical protein